MDSRDHAGAGDGVADLIPIGRFARLSGLSIGALRHYDELDLLRPADVDRFTGYRRYRPDQLEIARAIGRLRDLEVPIDEIREVLGADDPADGRRRIGAHERRLQARVDRLVHLLQVTRQRGQGKEPLMSAAGTTAATDALGALDAETHRRLGKNLFNHTWTLIEKTDRTPAETDDMIHATHASAWHWARAGGSLANAARGEWQIARVYSTLAAESPRCGTLSGASSSPRRPSRRASPTTGTSQRRSRASPVRRPWPATGPSRRQRAAAPATRSPESRTTRTAS